LNDLLAHNPEFEKLEGRIDKITFVHKRLSEESKKAFHLCRLPFKSSFWPIGIPHGNVQVAKIETEKLLIEAVELN
jgi:diphosphate-dependent phosphofructokinase